MIARLGRVLGIAIGIWLLSSGIAWANSLAPFIWLWPGVIIMSGWGSLPATVLAAVIERPFVTRAGLNSQPLIFSLQANALSLLAGFVAVPIAGAILYTPLILLWPFAAVTCSIIVESVYLRIRAVEQGLQFKRTPIVIGNLCSSGVLMLISAFLDTWYAVRLPWTDPGLWSAVERVQPVLYWFTAACGIALIASFFLRPYRPIATPNSAQGEEVLEEPTADATVSPSSSE